MESLHFKNLVVKLFRLERYFREDLRSCQRETTLWIMFQSSQQKILNLMLFWSIMSLFYIQSIFITERNKSEACFKKPKYFPSLPGSSWLSHGERSSMGPLMGWGRSIFCLSSRIGHLLVGFPSSFFSCPWPPGSCRCLWRMAEVIAFLWWLLLGQWV